MALNADGIKKEYSKIMEELSNPEIISDFEKFEELSRRKKELDKIVEKINELEDIEKKIKENKAMVAGQEPELADLAQAELGELQEKEKELKKEVENLLKEDDSPTKNYSAIIEIRAGAGGEEAALFAQNLYNMYLRYAELKGWKSKVLESHPTELGGCKEIIFEIQNPVFDKLKYEGGVHRVQRIPETEKQGRIHTSTASVAVLAKPKKQN